MLAKIISILRQSLRSPYYGFVQGHSYLNTGQTTRLRGLVGVESKAIIDKYEAEFSTIVGDGSSVSFAAGRMGFYSLMRILGIGEGDEVILLGATCAVMPNAVLRAGAHPIFSDVDPETFGSSIKAIERCVTPKTRLIVAQHSFGIPCDILPIVELGKAKSIFILEDCALSLGSKYLGTSVGNFGDASLFSTDHSKPMNTIAGGVIYSNNSVLVDRLRTFRDSLPAVPLNKQRSLFRQFLLERNGCLPQNYAMFALRQRIDSFLAKISSFTSPFFGEDSGNLVNPSYPYPARMPVFLAQLGLYECDRWEEVATQRQKLLASLIDLISKLSEHNRLPVAYTNGCLDIIPLRLAWTENEAEIIRNELSEIVNIGWTWFLQPVIATSVPIEKLGYIQGSCPVSEKIGPQTINVPCNIYPHDSDEFIQRIIAKLG
jgi:perosamine synthetase